MSSTQNHSWTAAGAQMSNHPATDFLASEEMAEKYGSVSTGGQVIQLVELPK
jgi:hypothetical protein